MGGGERCWGPGQKVSVNRAFLQPGLQRLAGLVELVDAVYEDLRSCYGVYASLFHRWGPGSFCPCSQPFKCCHQGPGMGVNRCLRCFLCSIVKIDFFTLTFRQLERLVRQRGGERPPG